MRVRYIPRAQSDVDEIYRSIAENNVERAQRVEDAIRAHGEMLGMEPELGVATGHNDMRRWPMAKLGYAIFYRIDWVEETVDVLRVIPGKQVKNLNRVPR
jgi:plasmid stabilization system protein ParE